MTSLFAFFGINYAGDYACKFDGACCEKFYWFLKFCMNFICSLYDALIGVRHAQDLNYVAFLLLTGYVLCAAALMKWGNMEVWGRLDLKEGRHHNYGIEGLRGPLAFFVIISHYLLTQNILINGVFGLSSASHERLAMMGGLSVCYFFAITGYLFWRKFLKNPDTSTTLLYYGRAARILPAFLFLCVVSLILIFITDPLAFVGSFDRILWGILSLFVPNANSVQGSFSKWAPIDVGPTWTLYWEFLFYALLPCLFAARRVVGPLGFHLVFPLLLAYWDSEKHSMLFIWVGTLVADCAEWLENSSRPYIDNILYLLAPVIFVYSFLRGESPYSPWYCLVTGVVVLALARGSTFWGVLKFRSLQGLGRIGYSTYLFHGVIIHASIYLIAPFCNFASLDGLGVFVYLVCLLPMLVIVSVITFRYLERPFLYSSAKWSLARGL